MPFDFYGLEHQVPAMLASGGGSIVNNASLAGVGGVGGLAAYLIFNEGYGGSVDLCASDRDQRRRPRCSPVRHPGSARSIGPARRIL